MLLNHSIVGCRAPSRGGFRPLPMRGAMRFKSVIRHLQGQNKPNRPVIVEQDDDDDEEEDVTEAQQAAPAEAAQAAEEVEEVMEEIVEEEEEEEAVVAPPPPKATKGAKASIRSVATQSVDPTPTPSSSGLRLEVSQQAIRVGVGLVTSFLGITFAVAVFRYAMKFRSAGEVRKRLVNKNLRLIQLLQEYLPEKRTALTPSVARGICGKVGFSKELVFRKYIWFALRERKFDPDLINDLLQLKAALTLSDTDVAKSLKERAERIAAKYGPLMVQTDGLTAKGVEKKAALRAFFSKLLFLTEQVEPLVAPAAVKTAEFDLCKIFMCTEREAERLRIVSLYDLDMARIEELATTKTDEETEEKGTGEEGKQQ